MSIFTDPAASAPDEAQRYVAAVLELLGDREPMDVLGGTPRALRQVAGSLGRSQLAQPEGAGKWSIAQVLQHLADSELVSGYRLRVVLAEKRPRITGYDQDRWCTRLHYEQADAETALEQFSVLRRSNLMLLKQASAADWQRAGLHSERGEESLDRMVRLMAGHDLLHLRQIDRVLAIVQTGREPPG